MLFSNPTEVIDYFMHGVEETAGIPPLHLRDGHLYCVDITDSRGAQYCMARWVAGRRCVVTNSMPVAGSYRYYSYLYDRLDVAGIPYFAIYDADETRLLPEVCTSISRTIQHFRYLRKPNGRHVHILQKQYRLCADIHSCLDQEVPSLIVAEASLEGIALQAEQGNIKYQKALAEYMQARLT